MAGHHWHFLKTTLVDDVEVGPITEAEFIREIKNGTVKPSTQVSSPTRTKGGWLEAKQVPKLAAMIEQVAARKRRAKAEKKAEKLEARSASKQQRQAAKVAAKEAAAVRKPTHEQSPAAAITESGDAVLYSASPSMFRQSPVLFVLLCLMSIFIIGLPFLVIWFLRCRSQRLTITNEKTTMRHGLLSKHESEVWHEDVRNVVLAMGVTQRIFNVGTISVSSAATDTAEIVASGFPDPERIKSIVNSHRKRK